MGSLSEALEHLTNVELWSAVNMFYTVTVGFWWTFPLYMTIIMAVAILSQNVSIITSFVIVTGVPLLYYGYFPSPFEYILFFIVVMCFAVLLYKVFGLDNE